MRENDSRGEGGETARREDRWKGPTGEREPEEIGTKKEREEREEAKG